MYSSKILKRGILGSVTAILISVAAGFISVNADSETASGDTKVTFTAPTTGQLVLNKVPSFDFGSQELKSNFQGFDATGSQAYDVTNLTGDSNGYTVTAQAGELNNGTNAALPVSTLTTETADGVADSVTGGQITGVKSTNIYLASNKVAIGNANSNGEFTSGSTGATLSLSTPNGIKTGTYTGTIDYTLTAGIN